MKACRVGSAQPEQSTVEVKFLSFSFLFVTLKVIAGCEVDRAVNGDGSWGDRQGRNSNQPEPSLELRAEKFLEKLWKAIVSTQTQSISAEGWTVKASDNKGWGGRK